MGRKRKWDETNDSPNIFSAWINSETSVNKMGFFAGQAWKMTNKKTKECYTHWQLLYKTQATHKLQRHLKSQNVDEQCCMVTNILKKNTLNFTSHNIYLVKYWIQRNCAMSEVSSLLFLPWTFLTILLPSAEWKQYAPPLHLFPTKWSHSSEAGLWQGGFVTGG